MDDATAFLHSSMPLCATLGMTAGKSDADAVVVSIDWDEGLCTVGGILHGGAVMALADAAGALLAYHNLPEDATGTTTIESKTNFLGAARTGTVTATATALHVGGTTIVVESVVRAGDRPVAKVTQTQLVLRS
jgi:uncharacterized protein (TIGR00369 family)